jgi:hypothetical protein
MARLKSFTIAETIMAAMLIAIALSASFMAIGMLGQDKAEDPGDLQYLRLAAAAHQVELEENLGDKSFQLAGMAVTQRLEPIPGSKNLFLLELKGETIEGKSIVYHKIMRVD